MSYFDDADVGNVLVTSQRVVEKLKALGIQPVIVTKRGHFFKGTSTVWGVLKEASRAADRAVGRRVLQEMRARRVER